MLLARLLVNNKLLAVKVLAKSEAKHGFSTAQGLASLIPR